MDPRAEDVRPDPVVVTGLGHVIAETEPVCDPLPYLKVKKLRKYMGVQDDLAVIAAARALESAGLLARSAYDSQARSASASDIQARSASEGCSLGERAGLYLVVGYIPFEEADLAPLLAASLDDHGHFSMEAFSTTGYRSVNGLLTFRCLPNMPAFHVSVNFDIQGPYFVTYPGPGQFYQALEEASIALTEGAIDVALVGGVAHQRNFLVESHFARLEPPVLPERLGDAAGFLVLEHARYAAARDARARLHLLEQSLRYDAHNPLEMEVTFGESFQVGTGCPLDLPFELGPASLPVMLSLAKDRKEALLTHFLESGDGFVARSRWGPA